MGGFDFNLRDLSLREGGNWLRISDVRFTISSEKTAVALLGESGIGKTTVFKSLFPRYVELWRYRGSLIIKARHQYDGQVFTEIEIFNNKIPLRIGIASQLPFFLEDLSVEENIFMPIKWKKMPSYSNARKREYLARWRLTELAGRKMSVLSGGQRQLVNLARSMIIDPDLLIIDECFSSMNEGMANDYIDIIKNEFGENTKFIITSHRKSDVKRFGCDILELFKDDHGVVRCREGESNETS